MHVTSYFLLSGVKTITYKTIPNGVTSFQSTTQLTRPRADWGNSGEKHRSPSSFLTGHVVFT